MGLVLNSIKYVLKYILKVLDVHRAEVVEKIVYPKPLKKRPVWRPLKYLQSDFEKTNY